MELTGTDNLLRVRPNGRQDGFAIKSPRIAFNRAFNRAELKAIAGSTRVRT
jgi:hypothetical protein